jgi:pimeloyl-ACP methyl ester carboxylesterase
VVTFVLVHGGWGGAWEWRPVAERLTRLGHSALTPSLAGLGERSHELSRHITLETHAADVVDVVESQPEARVILVGHS